MGPRAEEKIEKRDLDWGQKFRKMGPKKCRTSAPSQKADSHGSGNRIRSKQKWTICYWRLFFLAVFIRRAPVEDNTT